MDTLHAQKAKQGRPTHAIHGQDPVPSGASWWMCFHRRQPEAQPVCLFVCKNFPKDAGAFTKHWSRWHSRWDSRWGGSGSSVPLSNVPTRGWGRAPWHGPGSAGEDTMVGKQPMTYTPVLEHFSEEKDLKEEISESSSDGGRMTL